MYSVLLLSFLLSVEAATLPQVFPRGKLPLGCEGEYEDIEMVELSDGPTISGEAGIGAEFETIHIEFTNNQCGLSDTFAAKRHKVQGHAGTNYVLSVDTSVEMGAGKVSAEYVLNGTTIKVGNGSATAAGRAARDDLINWKPWEENPPNQIVIEDYPQCPDPWIVRGLTEETNKDRVFWSPQVTAAMPLEALYSLMKENLKDPEDDKRNILNGKIQGSFRGQNIQLVTEDYFKSLSLVVDKDDINDAVLGFCSLVLSYAKAASIPIDPEDQNVREMSPKSWIPFMPRTEFVTIYSAVKSAFGRIDQLFDIFNTLACYKTDSKGKVSIDEEYCGGDVENPEPGDKFGGLEYKYVGAFPNPDVPRALSIKKWIQQIDTGSPTPDLLTTFDKNFDSSIGGLGTSVEKMYNLRRTAPLFEFRDLESLTTSDFEVFMDQVDSSIQDFHQRFASPPTMKVRVKRQSNDTGCELPTPTQPPSGPITSPPIMPSCRVQYEDPDQGIDTMGCICGSSTLPLLTVPSATEESQSCAYTYMPTNATNPITSPTQSWTSNCHACTLVGGIADVPTCTSVSGCTPTPPAPSFAVFLSSNSIPVGDENNANGGADMRNAVYNKLKALCPDDATSCDSTTDASFDDIPTVVDDGEEYEKMTFTIQDSHYDTTDDRDRMLAAAVSSWQQAVGRSCSEVEYEAEADPTESGCGDGSVKRNLTPREFAALRKREPICEECEPPVVECTYRARICSGPDHISVVFPGNENPYENHMDIDLGWELDGDSAFDEFTCEVIIDGITAVAMTLAPELAGPDIMEDVEFQAMCAELAKDN